MLYDIFMTGVCSYCGIAMDVVVSTENKNDWWWKCPRCSHTEVSDYYIPLNNTNAVSHQAKKQNPNWLYFLWPFGRKKK
jgi:hypothetical protein